MARSRLAGVSINELKAEIRRRKQELEKLEAACDRLGSGSSWSGRLEAPRSTPAPPPKKRGKKKAGKAADGRRRPRGQRSLPEMLLKIMSPTEPKRVNQLAAEVKRRGYKTRSSDFGAAVSAVLGSDPRFKRVARGQYVLVQ